MMENWKTVNLDSWKNRKMFIYCGAVAELVVRLFCLNFDSQSDKIWWLWWWICSGHNRIKCTSKFLWMIPIWIRLLCAWLLKRLRPVSSERWQTSVCIAQRRNLPLTNLVFQPTLFWCQKSVKLPPLCWTLECAPSSVISRKSSSPFTFQTNTRDPNRRKIRHPVKCQKLKRCSFSISTYP